MQDSLGITAMAISRSRKYLAVAEKSDKAMIAIIDLHTRKKRNKSLVTSEAQSSRYVSLSWSPDEEWLIAQGAEPEWKLVLWRWQRSQVRDGTRPTLRRAELRKIRSMYPSPA